MLNWNSIGYEKSGLERKDSYNRRPDFSTSLEMTDSATSGRSAKTLESQKNLENLPLIAYNG